VIVVYTPADGEPEHYDASTLKVSEASIVQRTVDMKWQEILRGLEEDDLNAMRGIVWVIKKRANPTLRFGEFDPGVLEMTSRMDNFEIKRWLDATLDAIDPELPWETVENLISSRIADVAIDPEYVRSLLAARGRDPKDTTPDEPSKAAEPDEASNPSPTSSSPETPTSDSSLTSSTSPLTESTA
jgi:hypothetical protein